MDLCASLPLIYPTEQHVKDIGRNFDGLFSDLGCSKAIKKHILSFVPSVPWKMWILHKVSWTVKEAEVAPTPNKR